MLLLKGYYYVAVSLKGKSRGTYTINIGPNEDLLYKNTNQDLNRWVCQGNDPEFSRLNIYIKYIQYFTYEQTILFYRMLKNREIDLGEYADKYGMQKITPEELFELRKNDNGLAMDLAGYIVGTIMSLSNASAPSSIAVSSIFLIAGVMTDMGSLDKDLLISKIEKECEIMVIPTDFDSEKYTARYCLALKVWYSTDSFGDVYDVMNYSHLDRYFRGVKYAKGDWVKA